MAQRQIFAIRKTFESMLDKNTRDRIKDLIGREVVPAIGCTEPVAVALAVAKATGSDGGSRRATKRQSSHGRRKGHR